MAAFASAYTGASVQLKASEDSIEGGLRLVSLSLACPTHTARLGHKGFDIGLRSSRFNGLCSHGSVLCIELRDLLF